MRATKSHASSEITRLLLAIRKDEAAKEVLVDMGASAKDAADLVDSGIVGDAVMEEANEMVATAEVTIYETDFAELEGEAARAKPLERKLDRTQKELATKVKELENLLERLVEYEDRIRTLSP